MKNLQIDILGEAPSLSEIENYNRPYLKWGNISQILGLSILGIASVLVLLSYLVLDYSILLEYNSFIIISLSFSFILWAGFMIYGFIMFDEVEKFISPKTYPYLKEIIGRHSKIAAYRDQVIEQGREFLKSEYEAFMEIDERTAYKEVYRANYLNNSTEKANATT